MIGLRLLISIQEKIACIARANRRVIASALLCFTPAVFAQPVSYTFEIVGDNVISGIGAMGTFSGEDTDGNGILSLAELTSFSIFAFQYNNPDFQIDISEDDAVVNAFSLRLFDSLWSFDVTNGIEPGDPGYQAAVCNPCVSFGGLGIWRDDSPILSRLINNVRILVDQVPPPPEPPPEPPLTLEPKPVPTLPITGLIVLIGLLALSGMRQVKIR